MNRDRRLHLLTHTLIITSNHQLIGQIEIDGAAFAVVMDFQGS